METTLKTPTTREELCEFLNNEMKENLDLSESERLDVIKSIMRTVKSDNGVSHFMKGYQKK